MAKKKYAAITLGSFLSICSICQASQQKIDCPLTIAATSIRVENAATGWTPFIAASLYLNSAAPIYGPPDARGDIADFTTRMSKTEWSYTYQLDGHTDGGKWLRCSYGENHEITLSRPIEDSTRECTITYRRGKKIAQNEVKILCTSGLSK